MRYFTALGLIYEINPTSKGYTRLSIAANIPFKLKFYKFNVWDTTLLMTDMMEPYKVGDEVKVTYNYKKTFINLVDISRISLDTCPVCFSYQEATDAQRMDCPGCNLIPESDHKKRINSQMTLTSYESKEYLNYIGYRLYFFDKESKRDYLSVIFHNNPLYGTIEDLKVGCEYFVVGWEIGYGKMIEIVDIY